jgi:DNA polymerase III subunit beta
VNHDGPKGFTFAITRNKITAIATDGHRMAINSAPIRDDIDISDAIQARIPHEAVVYLIDILTNAKGDIEVLIGDRFFVAACDEFVFTSFKNIPDNFDFNKFIPEETRAVVELDTDTFKKALQRSVIFRHANPIVRLQFSKNQLKIIANKFDQTEKVEQTLPIDFDGSDFNIAINPLYLLENIIIFKNKKLKLSFPSNVKAPVLIEEVDYDDSRFLLMPLKQ